MLLLHEAIQTILVKEGQLMLSLDTYLLDKSRLEQIFISVLREFENKQPLRDKEVFPLSPYGLKMPDYVIEPLALRPYAFFTYNKIAAPIERRNWDWNPNTKILKCLMTYSFEVTYLKGYTTGNFPVAYQGPFLYQGEDKTKFLLKGDFNKGSLHISKGNSYLKDLAVDNEGKIVLGGTLGYGTVDPDTLEVNLTLTDTLQGDLSIEFNSKYLAIQELNLSSIVFMTWLSAEVLKSLANMKTQFNMIAGLPADMTIEGLLARAQQLEDKLEEMLTSKSKWWEWGS